MTPMKYISNPSRNNKDFLSLHIHWLGYPLSEWTNIDNEIIDPTMSIGVWTFWSPLVVSLVIMIGLMYSILGFILISLYF